MTDSRTVAGNVQNGPWASCSARKWITAKIQQHNKRNTHTLFEGMSKGQRSQLKELPVAKAGTI